ncbi:hypothetical protein LY624_11750 [Pseudoalteromonas sp. N1230-9]|uniref:DUF6795 domain-containing protein n=1 Tax=Pseudoalteromonas sp. N1230-9 TaxID=2907156 RepID=UPI002B2D829A|nr:hypothetical protein LY624_11750 [Pseudoalteromonas sp. N1230-9]
MFSWFRKKKEVFLCPEVNGIVAENGQPITNLEIIRALTYIDGVERRDTVTTGKYGHFHFPKKTILTSIPNKLISEDRVHQKIVIEKDDQSIIGLWGATQLGIDEIPEYTDKLKFLNCELTNPLVRFEFKNNTNEQLNRVATSICTWKEDYIPTWIMEDGEEKYEIHNGDLNNLTERFTGKKVEQ